MARVNTKTNFHLDRLEAHPKGDATMASLPVPMDPVIIHRSKYQVVTPEPGIREYGEAVPD